MSNVAPPVPPRAPAASAASYASSEVGEHAAEAARSAAALARVAGIVARLRAPGGCAWDAEQTHASLVPYLLEEAAEAAAAAREGEPAALRDELGDVLLQVLLHAQIAQETRAFDLADVADGLADKLVRRHPHVFAGASAEDGARAEALWEAQKAQESGRQGPGGTFAGVPTALPALQRAQKTAKRAAKVGFDWPNLDGPLAKLDEEIAEVREAIAARAAAASAADGAANKRAQQAVADELGDALFSLVNVARHLKVDAEETLHRTIARFGARFALVEAGLQARGLRPEPAHVDLMEQLWQEAKRNLA